MVLRSRSNGAKAIHTLLADTATFSKDKIKAWHRLAFGSVMFSYCHFNFSAPSVTIPSKKTGILDDFLDYDATLSPIVDNPDRAFMSENMPAAVKNVAEYFLTAIISGRSREKFVRTSSRIPVFFLGIVSDGQCRKVEVPAGEHDRFEGEPVPSLDLVLVKSLGLNDDDHVLAIYIGDNRTDEDAFKVLSEVKNGFGILVSSAPKGSNAVYSLSDLQRSWNFSSHLWYGNQALILC
ncbi:hypothetical protein TSUD_401500 [Trifolium subterraneum]|uniref:Trehalose-phosphatase n=1 Tax=Trifolium subterraneum TaxID=3900 RepID=A0A2Z6PLI6_TRISU|nr:hypothetical protein TSUD_401500 [Trifolium subterraneum]